MPLHMSGKFISMYYVLCRVNFLLYLDYSLLSFVLSDQCALTFFITRTINGCYGVPAVHYKGRQGDYYILVSLLKLIMCNAELIFCAKRIDH